MSAHEARVFGTYLVHESPTKDVIELYEAAMQANSGAGDKADETLLQLVLKRPWLLSSIDAGLALVKPNSEVRRRIYVMFSILESMPEYHERFLPKQHSSLFIVTLIAVGIRAVLRAIAGVVIVKVVAR